MAALGRLLPVAFGWFGATFATRGFLKPALCSDLTYYPNVYPDGYYRFLLPVPLRGLTAMISI